MPLAVGWWVYVDPRGIPVVSNYHLATVPVVVLALVSILGTIVFLPAMAVDPGAEGAGAATQLEGPILIVLIVLSGLYVVLTPGLFAADKAEVLRATGRGHYLFYNLCAVGFVYCAIAGWGRNRWLLLVAVLGILLALFIGHRWAPALAIAGTLYVTFRDRPVSSIGWKRGLAVVAAIVALALYKLVSSKIKRGDFAATFSRLADGPFAGNALFGMEPFITLAHLDFVVTHDFALACTNLWRVPLSLVPFMDTMIDDSACSYNHQVQPVFFSGYDSGVGANIWAEFFANFGYLGIPVLVAIVIALCRALEYVLRRVGSPALRAGIILGIVQLTVFIQRNELLGAFVLAKRAILVALLVFLLAWLLEPTRLAQLREGRVP